MLRRKKVSGNESVSGHKGGKRKGNEKLLISFKVFKNMSELKKAPKHKSR